MPCMNNVVAFPVTASFFLIISFHMKKSIGIPNSFCFSFFLGFLLTMKWYLYSKNSDGVRIFFINL
jgi:hypothetical protein